jgi:hypothetical protein
MKTIELKVYEYSELSEEAKETAWKNWLNKDHEYFWADTNEKTLYKFADIFPIKINGYNYDSCSGGISFSFTGEHDIEEMTGFRLAKYIWNNYKWDIFKGKYYGKLVKTFKDGTPIPISKEHPAGLRHIIKYSNIVLDNCCVLTGYCVDDDILQPVYDFLKKPNDKICFYDLMEKCLDSWIDSCKKDCAYQESQEFFEEEAEANGYEFDEEGETI